MSIMLFPPSRSNENLVYLILPLSLALLVTSLFNTNMSDPNWLSLTMISVSILALLLFILRPLDFAGREYLRRRVTQQYEDNLTSVLESWNNLELWAAPSVSTRKYARSMIRYAVSSTPIKERCNRIKMLIYFGLSFLPYLIVGAIYAKTIIFPPEWFLMAVTWVIAILLLVCPPYLIFIGTSSRHYGAEIMVDIYYVAAFIYVLIYAKKGNYQNSIVISQEDNDIQPDENQDEEIQNRRLKILVREIDFFVNLLLSGDIALFVRTWQDFSSVIGQEQIQRTNTV